MRTYRPSIVQVLPRTPGNDDLLTALVILLAVALVASLIGNVTMIEAADQHQQNSVFLCFDRFGNISVDDDWKECGVYTITQGESVLMEPGL